MTTAAIGMGDGHVVHSCGDCEVEVPMGSRTIAHRFYVMDTEAFHFVLGTDFFAQHSQIPSLTLQAPYPLYVDHGTGRESVPLEQSEHTSSYLRVSKEEPSNMMAASKTEDYHLFKKVPTRTGPCCTALTISCHSYGLASHQVLHDLALSCTISHKK